MQADIAKILFPREQIAQRVDDLAGEIVRAYDLETNADLVLVSILSGALIFTADLMRRLPQPMRIGLITVSAYRGATTESRGARVLRELDVDVTDRHVLLVDDILDTGGTLRLVRERLLLARPRSLRTCVLLRKPSKAPIDLPVDFVGFDIDNEFVVGYGLDYNDLYRNLPDIGVLKKELYSC
ncbi:MAG: hypoxanthine phosphoribosyltransferase [Phycisphaerales bacterium]|nr:hypoxanthine phosphoribosyltransferase [Phycisphaerales bacterium]